MSTYEKMKDQEAAVRGALKIWNKNFTTLARNGRWGTCVACPQDAAGNDHPEFCTFTDRYDHHLTAATLAEGYDREVRAQLDQIAQRTLREDPRQAARPLTSHS